MVLQHLMSLAESFTMRKASFHSSFQLLREYAADILSVLWDSCLPDHGQPCWVPPCQVFTPSLGSCPTRDSLRDNYLQKLCPAPHHPQSFQKTLVPPQQSQLVALNSLCHCQHLISPSGICLSHYTWTDRASQRLLHGCMTHST